MGTLSRSESRNMYSWWWDSHISPKNSKWLKENLTDMDTKVKSMIKIIEVDEDTFAKRAEMYYKKRPELMKLVEEFYRAYRALAERYDHATGVIREAHTTMAETFPNQAPFLMNEDGPGSHTPETLAPIRAILHLDELQNDDTGLSSDFTNGPDSISVRKEPKNLNGVEKARKGLDFEGVEEKDVLSESDRLGKSESDIQELKEFLGKLKEEKKSGLLEYQKTVERLSKLESDFLQAKGDSFGLNERAIKAEAQVESLKEFLAKVEVEREASLTQYCECLNKIANLEGKISRTEDDVCKAENLVTGLTEEVSGLKSEKETLLAKYIETLEKLANLENKILLAEDYASLTTERAEKAEKEVEFLKETIIKLTEEKEIAVVKYEESLEKIKTLEYEIVVIQEEAERVNKSLQSEVESLEEKVGVQNQELSEKEREMGRLWICVQEERMRFIDAEASFKELQNLHLNVQEELKTVANELQKKVKLLKELENEKQLLEDENTSLHELNLNSDVQRNVLQQEIHRLKEELNNLSQKHQELQDENSKLKESYFKSTNEITGLVERLGMMETLIQKNEILENSLTNLNSDIEEGRGKVKELEESCNLLITEKSTLESRLEMTTENLKKLSEQNTILENSIFYVNAEFEMLRMKSRVLEDSCKVLNEEKQILACELDLTHNKLVDLEKIHVDLEGRYSILEEERESTLKKVEILQSYLASEKLDHANSKNLSQTQINDLENQIERLQKDGDHIREEFEEELDNAVDAQFEIFILRKCIQDLKENNSSLIKYCGKLLKASSKSEKIISQLEKDNVIQNDEVQELKMGIFRLFDTLGDEIEPSCDDYSHEDQRFIHLIQAKLENIKESLSLACDENQELVIQKSVLIEVIHDLNSVVHAFKQEIGIRNTEVVLQQNEIQKLLESNEELILKVREGNMKEAILLTQVEILQEKLLNLQNAYDSLQNENSRFIEGNKSLEEEKRLLEDECSCMMGEVVELDNLSVIFKNLVSEKARNVIFLENELKEVLFKNNQLKGEVKLWETVAGTFFTELQSSSFREALIKGKFSDLVKAYEDESYSTCMDMAKLREKVLGLEIENSELKDRLMADLEAIVSLKDSLMSLEKHAISLKKIHEIDDGEKEEFENKQSSNESQSDGLADFHEIQTKIQDVEKSLIEVKQNSEKKYSSIHSDLEAALQQLSILKSQRRLRRSTRLSTSTRVRTPSEEDLITKDIVLDQASDLWSLRNPSSESLATEKELGIDEQSNSKKILNPLLEDNKKILERLASDVQKLTNLQITVRDLKEKMEKPENAKEKTKVVEHENMKEQIEESEKTILKLFDYSNKVMKIIENSTSALLSASTSLDGMPAVDSSDVAVRRKKSIDQARRISEKIGRLHLEIQKVQFFLMKHENNKVGKTGKRVVERSTRVLLRDYLYGGLRTPRRRKQTRFFGCVEPDTNV